MSDVTNHSVTRSPVGDRHVALKSLVVTVFGSDGSLLRAVFDTGNSTMKSLRPSRSTTFALSGSSLAFLRPRYSAPRARIRARLGDPARPLSTSERSPGPMSSKSSFAISVSDLLWGPNL